MINILNMQEDDFTSLITKDILKFFNIDLDIRTYISLFVAIDFNETLFLKFPIINKYLLIVECGISLPHYNALLYNENLFNNILYNNVKFSSIYNMEGYDCITEKILTNFNFSEDLSFILDGVQYKSVNKEVRLQRFIWIEYVSI